MKKLFKAIRDVDYELVKQLIDNGADLSYESPNTGRTVREFYTGGSMAKLIGQIE